MDLRSYPGAWPTGVQTNRAAGAGSEESSCRIRAGRRQGRSGAAAKQGSGRPIAFSPVKERRRALMALQWRLYAENWRDPVNGRAERPEKGGQKPAESENRA